MIEKASSFQASNESERQQRGLRGLPRRLKPCSRFLKLQNTQASIRLKLRRARAVWLMNSVTVVASEMSARDSPEEPPRLQSPSRLTEASKNLNAPVEFNSIITSLGFKKS